MNQINGDIDLKYSVFIAYNKENLMNKYVKLIKTNSTKEIPKDQEKVNQIFLNYVKSIITYQLCYLNANYIEIEENPLHDYEKNKHNLTEYSSKNYMLIDILAQIINIYQKGDLIEDCLYKIIKDKQEKIQKTELTNKIIFIMYILFPDELIKWTIFEGYNSERENKLKQIVKKVCGIEKNITEQKLKENVEKYISDMQENQLSSKQKEMLKILGFNISKSENITNNDEEENKPKDIEVIDENSSLIKRIINRIKNFIYRIKKS